MLTQQSNARRTPQTRRLRRLFIHIRGDCYSDDWVALPGLLSLWLGGGRHPPRLRALHIHFSGVRLDDVGRWVRDFVGPCVVPLLSGATLLDCVIDLDGRLLRGPNDDTVSRGGWDVGCLAGLADNLGRYFGGHVAALRTAVVHWLAAHQSWDTLWLSVHDWHATGHVVTTGELRLTFDTLPPPSDWCEQLRRFPPGRLLGLHLVNTGPVVALDVCRRVLATTDATIARIPRWELELELTCQADAAVLVAALDHRRRIIVADHDTTITLWLRDDGLDSPTFAANDDDGNNLPLLSCSALAVNVAQGTAVAQAALGAWLSRTLAPRVVTLVRPTALLLLRWTPSVATTTLELTMGPRDARVARRACTAFPRTTDLTVCIQYYHVYPAVHTWTPALRRLPRLRRLRLDVRDTPHRFNEVCRVEEDDWLRCFQGLLVGVANAAATTLDCVHCVLPVLHERFLARVRQVIVLRTSQPVRVTYEMCNEA